MNGLIEFTTKWRKKLDIDGAAFWMLLMNAFTIVKAPITTIFIVFFLTEEQQGVWYSFASLAAVLWLFELGFFQVIRQYLNFDYAGITHEDGILKGPSEKLDKIISLARFSIKYFSFIIIICSIVLVTVGLLFFADHSSTILIAWVLYAIGSALFIIPMLSHTILQGVDKLKETTKNHFFGVLAQGITSWVFLALGFGVYALAFNVLVGTIVMSSRIYKVSAKFWIQIFTHKISTQYKWFKEMFSLQWKYAVFAIGNYFVLHIHVPIVFQVSGEVIAGQLGITLAIVSLIRLSAEVFTFKRIPQYNILAAQKKETELLRLFKKNFIVGISIYFIGAVLLVLCLIIFRDLWFMSRMLPLDMFVLIIVLHVPWVIYGLTLPYIAAHKEQPLVIQSPVAGALILFVLLVVYPLTDISTAYIVINAIYWFIMLPWLLVIFIFKMKTNLKNEAVSSAID
ncbi:MAG: hypothetical protein FWB80_00525 [Defluviitaleaceae bacterium]|nr:hypothetical protein [Defluviitaleaceae bacterium]